MCLVSIFVNHWLENRLSFKFSSGLTLVRKSERKSKSFVFIDDTTSFYPSFYLPRLLLTYLLTRRCQSTIVLLVNNNKIFSSLYLLADIQTCMKLCWSCGWMSMDKSLEARYEQWKCKMNTNFLSPPFSRELFSAEF